VDIRNILFSNRSFTPIPIALTLIYFSQPKTPHLYLGLGLIIIGEFIRINAVRYAGGATRTTKVGAPSLCTAGPYSRTRNPLYLGNMVIYCGIVFFSGGIYMWELLFITFTYFTFQYSMIISLEEEKLIELFKNDYKVYCNNVPRLFPRIIPWVNGDSRFPLSIDKTIKTEKRTLQNLALILFSILLSAYFKTSL
tara:strand:- start:55 stop:639 length:585 start_codon:yes stop_codon:yes gene_type:complete